MSMGVITHTLSMLDKRRRKTEKKITSGHYVLPAMPKGSAGMSLGPKVCNMFSK